MAARALAYTASSRVKSTEPFFRLGPFCERAQCRTAWDHAFNQRFFGMGHGHGSNDAAGGDENRRGAMLDLPSIAKGQQPGPRSNAAGPTETLLIRATRRSDSLRCRTRRHGLFERSKVTRHG